MMFFKMFLQDILIGSFQIKKQVLGILFFAVTTCILFDNMLLSLVEGQFIKEPGTIGVFEYLAYILQGMGVYSFSALAHFELPIMWLLFYMLFIIQIGKYPSEDLYTFGSQVILRLKNKKVWFLSKCAWLLFSAVLYYFALFCVILLYCAFKGEISFFSFSKAFEYLFEVNFNNLNEFEIILWLVVIPILVLFCTALFQMVVALNSSPILGTLVAFVFIIFCVYFYFPFFIGNYMILMRTEMFISGFVTIPNAFLIIAFYSLTLIIAGMFLFERKEFLKNNANL